MLDSIVIRNYKAFGNDSTIFKLRPITLLIGKNSSGKSSLCKLLPMLSNAVSGRLSSPLLLKNSEIQIGSRFEDLFHNGVTNDLELSLDYDDGLKIGATYVMLDGNLMVYMYTAYNGSRGLFKIYSNKEKSEETHFNGLIQKDVLKELGIDESRLSFGVDYIGPIRVPAARSVEFEGFDERKYVGYDGGFSYHILLNSYLKKDGLFDKVSSWMEENMEGQKLDFTQTSPGVYGLVVERNGIRVNVADVGFGLAQALPIITQSYIQNENNITVIEQPALHLHPAAHANIAYRLADSAKTTGRKYLIETHSENFLLGLRKLVSDPKNAFSSKDVIVYYVHNDGDSAYLESIEIDEKGELSSWPTGVFSESFDLMSDIMNNQA